MSNNQGELQVVLQELLGSTNVYFQPPPNVLIKYPAIIYNLKNIETVFAANASYKHNRVYQVTLVDSDPNSIFVEELLKLPMCVFSNRFAKSNLTHTVFNLNY